LLFFSLDDRIKTKRAANFFFQGRGEGLDNIRFGGLYKYINYTKPLILLSLNVSSSRLLPLLLLGVCARIESIVGESSLIGSSLLFAKFIIAQQRDLNSILSPHSINKASH
jgi:hypothetical protein